MQNSDAKSSIEVIIGCRKQEQWINDAIWSARNQIQPRPLLLHPANLPDKFTEYSIKIVHDQCEEMSGTGASAARNRAIAESQAAWIIWLDADDMLPSHFLYTMHNAAIGYYEGHNTIFRAPIQFFEGARLDRIHSCPIFESTDLDIGKHFYPMGMSAMFPRQAWEEVHGFDETFRNMNDLDFWVRCGKAGYNFSGVSTFLLRRDTPGSLTNTANENATLAKFNEKHGTQLTHRYLPYRAPMRNEC